MIIVDVQTRWGPSDCALRSGFTQPTHQPRCLPRIVVSTVTMTIVGNALHRLDSPFSFSSPLLYCFSNVALLSIVHERFFISCSAIALSSAMDAQRLEVSDAGTLTTSCATSMNASQDIGRICMVMIQEMYQKLAARVSAAYSTLEHLACII
jgi:hypothetical protein